MKKRFLFIVSFVLIASLTYAVDIETMLEKAKECSHVYQGYEISRSNTVINQQQKDLEGITVSANGGIINSDKITDISASKITVTIPNVYDDFDLIVATDISKISLREKSPFSITPSVKVTKLYKMNSYTDTRSEIEETKTNLQNEYSYQNNVYSFENSLINAVINIMNSETNLRNSKKSYESRLKTYENDKRLGSIEEGSLADIEQQMSLASLKANYDKATVNYEKSLVDFKQQYGIDYEAITKVRDANLSFTPSEDGNYSVYTALLTYEYAQQELTAAQGYSSTLNLTGSAGSSFNFNSKQQNKVSVDIGASVSYKASNWSVDATVKDTFGKGLSMIPTISVSGSWSNSTTKSTSDELNIQKLYNNVLERENAYNKALYNYNSEAQGLLRDIETLKNDVEQLEIKTQYHKTIVDYQTKLYDLGLTSQNDLDNAIENYSNDLQSAVIYKLQALILENRIKMFEF